MNIKKKSKWRWNYSDIGIIKTDIRATNFRDSSWAPKYFGFVRAPVIENIAKICKPQKEYAMYEQNA